MGQLSEGAKHTLVACGCDDAEVAQVAALCASGCPDEAVLRLRHRRSELMDDLHERQRRIDCLDQVVRQIRKDI